MPSTPSTQPVALFYSYAHKDEEQRKELEKHLSTLKRQNIIAEWHDRDISAGDAWASEINEHLNAARIILLLISPDFIASDYCYCVEMERALKRHEQGEACIIPIILRPTDLKNTPFMKFQALPENAKPIAKWRNKDDAFLQVAEGIRKVAEELSQTSIEQASSSQQIWHIPYRRNPIFTGRDKLIQRLHEKLTGNTITALSQAIAGLGGIGKTQTAIEYAYRYRSEYRYVLWASAASRETLITEFVGLAHLLNLPERNQQDQNRVVVAVKRWLAANEGWLLILDNADDLAMVHKEFLPTESKGHLLLTTRAQSAPPSINLLHVEKMNLHDGALFLLRRARILDDESTLEQTSPDQRADAEAIVRELDGLPLALEQAGAYIHEMNCGLTAYLQRYRTHRKELLKWQSAFSTDHPEPVATTWSLSFEQVEKANLAAAEVLRLCAFFDPDAIPEEVITAAASIAEGPLNTLANDAFKLDQAIRELSKFSLVKRNPDDKTLSVHRLVQVVIRDGMGEDNQRQWAEQAVKAVYEVFPYVKVETWKQCQRYVAHGLVCAELITRYEFMFEGAARLLNQIGIYLKDHALYGMAVPLLEQALKIDRQILGDEHANTTASLNNLGFLYKKQGRTKEAEQLYKKALAMRLKVLRENHPDTAQSMNNLGVLYKQQGRIKEAEELYEKALDIRLKVLGENHPDTASSMNNLGVLYKQQGRTEEAEQLYKRALEICLKILGENHPDTAWSLNNLGYLYENQGRIKEAEQLYQRALAIHMQILGRDHPDTTIILDNYVSLLRKMHRDDEADRLLQRIKDGDTDFDS